jgi:hypothetical protein
MAQTINYEYFEDTALKLSRETREQFESAVKAIIAFENDCKKLSADAYADLYIAAGI